MEISCKFLWVEWSKNDPNSNEVLGAKDQFAKYTAQDWANMSAEAIEMTDYLKELVIDKVDINDKRAEKGFDLFVEHFFKWFYPLTRKYALRLSTVIKFDNKYTLFFDQFTPGLADYMNKLLQKYSYKIDDGVYAKEY